MSHEFKSPRRPVKRAGVGSPGLGLLSPGIATPSPARHDAAFTMMSLLHVRGLDDVARPSDPMSPPQVSRVKRTRHVMEAPFKSTAMATERAQKVQKTTGSTGAGGKARSTKGSKRSKGKRSNSEYNRKDKSLGLLCEKFLKFYGDGNALDVCLDVAASKLSVERRRIYDIVNILESVGIVVRVAKNRYFWRGTAGLPVTLAKMQAVALREPDFVQAVRHTHDTQQAGEDSAISLEEAAAQVMAKNYKSEDDRHAALEATHGSDSMNTRPDGTSKRDRSLGGLSEKFVQIFLLGLRQCTLEQVARILLGDDCNASKLKTKVRRLYDIANVLCSLNLINKVYLSRKPAFKWLGASEVPLYRAPPAAAIPAKPVADAPRPRQRARRARRAPFLQAQAASTPKVPVHPTAAAASTTMVSPVSGSDVDMLSPTGSAVSGMSMSAASAPPSGGSASSAAPATATTFAAPAAAGTMAVVRALAPALAAADADAQSSSPNTRAAKPSLLFSSSTLSACLGGGATPSPQVHRGGGDRAAPDMTLGTPPDASPVLPTPMSAVAGTPTTASAGAAHMSDAKLPLSDAQRAAMFGSLSRKLSLDASSPQQLKHGAMDGPAAAAPGAASPVDVLMAFSQ